jgi:molybdopterin molybdotransferase
VLGLVLAEDVASDLDMPPFDKALMDGYAVRAADVRGEATLTVVEEVTAGRVATKAVEAGQATQIMTGTALPRGADAVVQVERTTRLDGNRVRLADLPRPGQNVMPRAKEMRKGETVLTAGTVLRPQELGLLAAVGRTSTRVYRRPAVAVLSTGDEVVEPSGTPGPGQIRNSNATLLAAQVARARAAPRYLGIARDTLDSLRPLVADGLTADVFLLSGGVSAGTLDLVPQVLHEAGVTPVFHKVAMKPGKPLFFGTKGGTLVFGLPGNPVSGLVGFELFVRPALRVLMGRADPGPTLFRARLGTVWDLKADRPTYHPARLVWTAGGWEATPSPWLGSADLRAVTQANAFIVFPEGTQHYDAGTAVAVLAPELDL